MMINILIVPATQAHGKHIAENMREVDIKEVMIINNMLPEEAMRLSIQNSEVSWCCLIDNEPSFAWGVCNTGTMMSRVGCPWLLATERVKLVTRQFIKSCHYYVGKMQDRFEYMENFILKENKIAIRWLKWCGFSFGERPIIKDDNEILRFWRIAHV